MNNDKCASLPGPFLRAIKHDAYNNQGSDYTVTQLLRPPQTSWLKKYHEPCEQSAYASYRALLGTMMHTVLENYADPNEGEIAERRFFIDYLGLKISGQIDLLDTNLRTVYDYKFYNGSQTECKPDHYAQIQINGLLVSMNGFAVDHVSVMYVRPDWSNLRATLDPTYDQSPFKPFVFAFDRQFAEERLSKCVMEHEEAAAGNPRPCTPDEQWAKPDTFALKKPANQKARKVVESYTEAKELLKPGEVIEQRKGERTKCRFFCDYRHVCPDWLQEKQKSQK